MLTCSSARHAAAWALVLALALAAPTFAQDAAEKPAKSGKKKATAGEKAADATTAKPTIALELKSDKDRQSYAMGAKLAGNIKATVTDINAEAFARAIVDVMTDQPLAMSDQEREAALAAYQQAREADMQKKSEEAAEKGKAYLESNVKKEGVKVLPSGLQYKVVREGTGRTPKATDRVEVHYRGTFIDGSVFDSSYDRNEPAQFGVTGVIKGWTEALQLMKEGAEWEICVPPDLAYGEMGRPPRIPPHSVLIFKIELLKVFDNPAAPGMPTAPR